LTNIGLLSLNAKIWSQTAAHCLVEDGIVNIDAFVGLDDLYTDSSFQSVQADSWTHHQNFETDNFRNDIGLVFLRRLVNNVEPVQLGFSSGGVGDIPGEGEVVTTIGFGYTKAPTGDNDNLSDSLREVDLNVIGTNSCDRRYYVSLANGRQFCAGGGEKAACSGDSGGPAVLAGGDATADIQVGIVSFGSPGCSFAPSVYTRVSGYETWIKNRACGRTNDPKWCDGFTPSRPNPPPSSPPPSNGNVFGGLGCFSSSSSVQVKGRGSIKMQDLRVGDLVQVGDNIYEPIYSFGHHGPGIKTEMLQIKTDNLSLRLTHDHIVITSAHGPIPAALVKVGDHVVVPPGTAIVREITSVNEEGLYAPFTPSGKLVVDGILVSAYVALEPTEGVRLFGGRWGLLSHHWLSHIVETPHRLVCHDFGMYCPSERYGSDGTNASLTVLLHFGQWVYEQRGTLRVFMMSVVVIVWGTLFLFEQLVLHPFLTAAFVLGLRVVRKCLGKNKLLTK
jgi:hypothetical protein